MRFGWNRLPDGRIAGWVALMLCSLASACSKPPPCQNEVSSEELSPNHQFKAVVFHRSCPDAPPTTNVSLLRPDESPANGNGNIMSYPGNVGIRVGWLTDQRLAVYSFTDLRKATRRESASGITIDYPAMVDADIVRPPTQPAPSASASPTASP
jgi:hypothetical protein